jgi:hypothetical protein
LFFSPRSPFYSLLSRAGLAPESTLAKKDTTENGHGRLEEAMAMLTQNQASFLGRLSETERLHSEFERATSERFARIEKQMTEIIRVLGEHGRLLEQLPEAVRDKIGFKTP